jgi:two-component system sensor histidine kinase MprB
MRIRWRLALLGTVLAAGTVVLFALLIVVLASNAAPRDQDTALEALATAAAAQYQPGGAAPALTVDLRTSLDPAVVVTDRKGTVVYAQALLGGAAPQVPASLVQDALARTVSRATVTLAGVEVRMVGHAWSGGVVVAVQQTAYLADQRKGLWWVVVLAAGFTAVAGAVASWVVSGRALRPLRALAATAGEIARTGDLSRRLDVPRSRDDVGALAREFNAMMDRLASSQAWLAAALDQQRRFVADASHELRTPLATIRSNAGFLAGRPDAAPADRAEALDDVRAEAERMAQLVDDLLVLARTDALPQPVRRPVDLAVLAAEVARRAGASVDVGTGAVPVVGPAESAAAVGAPAAADPSGAVGVSGVAGVSGAPAAFGGARTIVLGDEEMLRRLVGCLVDNAMLHGARVGGGDRPAATPDAETVGSGAERAGAERIAGAGTVVAVAPAAGGWVVLSVRDHGPGFPPRALDQVFERFYRGDPARRGRGSGLGLAIARAVAQLHGGGATAANAPDGGALVTVHLPAA